MFFFIFLLIPMVAYTASTKINTSHISTERPSVSGDLLLEATLFEEALIAFELENRQEKIAECLFYLEKYDEIITRFYKKTDSAAVLYFLILAFEKLGDDKNSLDAQHAFLKLGEENPQLKNESLYLSRAERFKTELALKKAQFHLNEMNFSEAEEALKNAPPTEEVLFCLIETKVKGQKDPAEIKASRLNFLEKIDSSPYRSEVSFRLYDFQDYLLGKKEALKHLKNFVKEYDQSAQSIVAWYLIGLDLKRDRKSHEGRWIHHKNLEQAADALSYAERIYQKINQDLNDDQKGYYHELYQKILIERARVYIEIADESTKAKKEIHLKYAEEVLKNSETLEGLLLLAEVLIKEEKNIEALKEIAKIENAKEKSEQEQIYAAKALLMKGNLHYRAKEPVLALVALNEAETLIPEFAFTGDERLNLKITKSLCHKDLKDFKEAMLILSEVVNSDFLSSLRIKAMYLRALVYESQGRHDLAKRQFEAALVKGGDWAKIAKEKWIKEYHLHHE